MFKYIIALIIVSFSLSGQNLPKLENWVTDLTNTLTEKQIFSLNKKLKDYQDSTSNQIVVLIIPSLDGNSIEQLANDIFKYNRIGTKNFDNGVLILLAKEDRAIRIEVGYGLEARLTDATSSFIIRNEIIPYLKEGNYYDGLNNGIISILKTIDGEYTANSKDEDEFDIKSFLFILIMLIIIAYISSRTNRAFRIGKSGGRYGGYWGGGFSGGFGGGGFSGGGGLSGGGGASGRW